MELSARTSPRGTRAQPKGRTVDDAARAEVRALIDETPRRDRLIEYLHALQDAYGALAPNHLTALAAELALAPAEVFEVASFYHH